MKSMGRKAFEKPVGDRVDRGKSNDDPFDGSVRYRYAVAEEEMRR
jgi:hypothetical protein